MLGGPNLVLRWFFRSPNMNFDEWGAPSLMDQIDSAQFNVFRVDIKQVGVFILG